MPSLLETDWLVPSADYLKPYLGNEESCDNIRRFDKSVEKERAHQDRYAGNEDKANELKKLLEVTAFIVIRKKKKQWLEFENCVHL